MSEWQHLVRRTRPGPQYLASVAVIWTEVIKLMVCVAAQVRPAHSLIYPGRPVVCGGVHVWLCLLLPQAALCCAGLCIE